MDEERRKKWAAIFPDGMPSRRSTGVYPSGLAREVLYFGQADFAWKRELFYKEMFDVCSSPESFR